MDKVETLIILDFGSQYTQLIARRVRELGVFSMILPFNTPASEITKHKPLGIVLSGGPNSVYDADGPKVDKAVFDLNIPILGICYGLQLITDMLGGKVESSPIREYGLAKISLAKNNSLILGKDVNSSSVWMSHGDHVTTPPSGFKVTAMSGDIVCGMENQGRNIFGLQFHPEVSHTEHGLSILKNFLVGVCHFSGDWTPKSFISSELSKIVETAGDSNIVCALSGGVDSSVAATLVDKAVGDQQTCIFVDNGLLRADEYDEVLVAYKEIGLNVKPIKASDRFMTKLAGVTDPERKRKIIGNEFIEIFEEEAKKIKGVKFLVQGTLYPDVIESVSVNGPSATIKSHHNVGGLPEKMNLKLIEPLRELFKDEVRLIGGQLGLPATITGRQPFPGPGLAIRIIGEVNRESVALLQKADKIVRQEVEKTEHAKDLWQYFAVLLPIKSVGVMGDGRTYEQVIALRIVSSSDGMTADWAKVPHSLLASISSRIISEVKGINRVVYDITSKPPGTIEWE